MKTVTDGCTLMDLLYVCQETRCFELKKKKKKERDDRMCSYCYDAVDYIEHFFFNCPTIKKFLNYIEQYILITFDIQTHLTVVVVLFGIKQHNYGTVQTKLINHVILIAKMCISMYKKN